MNWNKIGETPDFTSLKPMADFPEDPVEGEIALLSGEEFIDYKPEAPNGETVYGGNLEDFMAAIEDTGGNELWLKIPDGTPEGVELGYFHTENDVIDYYDYQGDMEFLYDDINEGEWVDANTIYLWKEGKNLYFYVNNNEDVYFPDTQSSMEFDTVVTNNTVNQYNNGDWRIFPQVLYSRGEFPKIAGLGDVVGIGNYIDREATSADVFTSATVTMVNGRATFKMYNPNYGGYCDEYTFGYDENEGIIGGWGGDNNVINGPWNDHGVEFSIDGDNITFTSQNPEDTEEALLMWGFDPNCNDRITTKELGLYQYNGEEWTSYATENDLSNYFRKEDGEENQDLLAWNGYDNTWGIQHRDDIVTQAIREAYAYDDNDGLRFFGRDSYWGIGWKKIDQTTLKPKEALPVEAEEDGSVFALSSSGYGIYQAQSAHTETTWFNLEGKTFPQGVVTKIRVPYNDDAESQIRRFKTDSNGEGEMSLYWHPEDTSNRYWDGLPEETQQNDGEFSAVDDWGNTMVGTKVGNYIEVTFGAPLYDGDEPIYTNGNVEVYTSGSVTDYRRVAFYDEIGSGGTYTLPAATQQTLGGIKVGSGLTVQADGTLSATGGGGGSSYITDLQSLGLNILEGQGVGFADDPQTPTQYTTIEPQSDGSAYVNNYTDDGQGGWMQNESYQLLRMEDIKNDQDDVIASGIIDSNDRVLKIDPDSDGTTQVGGYEPGVGDEPTFTRERYLVSSTNISKMVKITQTDYDTLVNNDEVDENTFYIVVPDPEPDPNEP